MPLGGGLAFLFALAWSPRLLAAPLDIRIEFDAPSDCAEVSSFYDRVRARTDRVRLAEAGVQALTLRVRVVRRGAKVHGQLRMTDEHGASTTREVEGASCGEVVDALSLTATLALDPTASPEAPPAAVPPPTEVVSLVATPSHPPPPSVESSLGFEAGVQGGFAEVLSPYLSLGGALFGRVTQETGGRVSWSLGLSLAHMGNDILQSADNVSARLTTLSLSACPARLDVGDAFSVEPCALFAGGLLSASSHGVSNPDSAVRSWWSAGALLRAALPIGGNGPRTRGRRRRPPIEATLHSRRPGAVSRGKPRNIGLCQPWGVVSFLGAEFSGYYDQPAHGRELKERTESMPPVAASAKKNADIPASGVHAAPDPDDSGLPMAAVSDREGRLTTLVVRYVDFVARVLRNAGTPQSEVDDDVQRTFIAAARRLDDMRPGSEKSFLLRIALNTAAHARRTLARRREVPEEDAPEVIDVSFSPEQLTEQKRARQMLDRVLEQMDVDLRTVFVLYEFEDLSMAEIAGILAIPRGTVASRLRRAREDFRERVRALQGVEKAEVRG